MKKLTEVEKDTSTGVTMNPSIQVEAVYDMNVPRAMADLAPQVLVNPSAKIAIVSDSQMLPLTQSNVQEYLQLTLSFLHACCIPRLPLTYSAKCY